MRNLSLKYWFLLLCVAALCPRAAAQPVQSAGYSLNPVTGSITSSFDTTFSGRVVDSLSQKPLPGAVISVVEPNVYYKNKTAVRNYVTDNKGQFRFTCDPSRDNRMEVSFLGYKIRTVWLGADQPLVDLGDVWMTESTQEIDKVIVNARMHLYKMRGDTTIYIPKAIKTMEGDKALEILRNMPGVEVSDNGRVTIEGKTVARTYINSLLLFGEDPTVALQQLDAAEVASIEAYDEVDEDEARKHGEHARKRKVLNVVTFEKFSHSFAANARAEAGADFEKDAEGRRPARYAATADAGYYSEDMQAVVKGLAQNVNTNNQTSGLNSKASAEASISGKVGETHRYNANYQYNHNKRENWTVGDCAYFPTEYFASKRSADTTRSENRLGAHVIATDYTYTKSGWVVGARLQGNVSDALANQQHTNRTEQDQALLLASARNTNAQTQANSFGGNFSVDKSFRKRGNLRTSFYFHQSNNRSTDLRHDVQTTAEGAQLSNLQISSSQPDRTFAGNASYDLPFSRAGSFSFNLSAETQEKKDRKLYVDPQTGLLQVALSDDAIDHLTRWKAGMDYSFYKGNHNLSLGLNYTLAPRNYRNRIFGTNDCTLYQMLDGSASYTYNLKKGSLSFGLSNSHMLPQGSNLSSRIDDSSLLFLSAGNPTLKPSKDYTMLLSGSILGEEGSFNFRLSTTLTSDPVIQKLTYFKINTVLPQYNNYCALAGSTLATPTNGGNSYGITPTLDYNTRIAPLACFIKLEADYAYRNAQEATLTGFGRANNHTTAFTLSLTSNFSSKVRIVLASRTEAGWYQSAAGYNDQSFREKIHATIRWDLLKRCVFTTAYTFEADRFESKIANSDNHLLNLSFGCRMLDRKATLSFNAYDILNQTKFLSIAQSSQGISYKWQRGYGSYFTFAFEYKFNDRK